jgi:hypothetical protein
MVACVGTFVRGDAAAPLYAENFDKLAEGEPPKEIVVYNGTFEVKKVDGNGVLELAANPLDNMGFLAGPNDLVACTVSARVQASATGRRFPEFGVSAAGPNRYKLKVMPATAKLILMNADEDVASAAYAWSSGSWTRLKLQVEKADGGKVRVRGKAWADGTDEPKEWMVQFEDAESPQPSRAGAFGTPYSGTVTRFDDVVVGP